MRAALITVALLQITTIAIMLAVYERLLIITARTNSRRFFKPEDKKYGIHKKN